MIHISKELSEILIGVGVTLFVYGVRKETKLTRRKPSPFKK